MARRVPKPLIPVIVAVAGATIAIGAALPSFAGPIITPPADGTPQHPAPSATATTAPATPAATTPAASTPPAAPPAPDSAQKGDQGPKDCSNCGVPPV